MEAIIFSVLGAAACAFLIYVFVQFHRELMRFKTGSARDSNLIYIGSREPEPGLPLVASYPYAGEERQAKRDADQRNFGAVRTLSAIHLRPAAHVVG
jgi:hypothetical protein